MFRCKDNGEQIPIYMFRPLFETFDEMFFFKPDACIMHGIIFNFLRVCMKDLTRILDELGADGLHVGNPKRRSKNVKYDNMRRLVFSDEGFQCYVELDRFKKFVNIPGDDVTANTVSALMAMFLWKNVNNLSSWVQKSQQSMHPRVRKTMSKFTALLKPFARSAEQIFQVHVPLYSIRKRCTVGQITDLKQRMACNKQVDITPTNIISASTSLEFCKKYQSVGPIHNTCPLLLTFTVESRDIPIFIPLMHFVKELGTDYSCHEYEVLILPGTQMQFRNIQSTTTANIETTTVDVTIIGTDINHIHTQPLIAGRVGLHGVDLCIHTQIPQQIADNIILAISDLSIIER